MSFLNEVKSVEVKIGRPSYKLEEIEKSLGKKEFGEFMSALKDPSISLSAIQKVLQKRNLNASALWLRKVRNGEEA
jgi:hypothetical protein